MNPLMSDHAEEERGMYTPGPWEYVPSDEHHGPYVVGPHGGDIADCYVMSKPGALSVCNDGDSQPVHFFAEMADPNTRLMPPPHPTPGEGERLARELLPCPFCGERKARTRQTKYRRRVTWTIACLAGYDCPGLFMTKRYGSEAEAIAAWNTRAALTGDRQ